MNKAEKEFSENSGYPVIRNMLAALVERILWEHNTICTGEEDVAIDAIANIFVQEHGDHMLLNMLDKLKEIYNRYPQRYQLIVRVNGDPFKTTMLSYLNIEECLEVAKNYEDNYDGNHQFTIVDTDINNRKVYDHDEVMSMLKPKTKHYFWLASSNDGAFEDFSATTFTEKEMCYNDMRNSALDKMKWNTEYREDFADMDDDEFIGYDVRFRKDKIIHESYSGLYTYQIFCVEQLKERPELFFGSQFCKDLKYRTKDANICNALMKINKRYLAD